MLKQSNKRLFLMIIILIILIPNLSFAEDILTDEAINVEAINNRTPLRDDRPLKDKTSDMFPNKKGGADAGLPNVTIDHANSWVERKGFEVIGFLQKFVQPFAIIIFILSAIMVLMGSFSNGRMLSQGFFGMFISLVMYVVVLYAPEIADIFLSWVQS